MFGRCSRVSIVMSAISLYMYTCRENLMCWKCGIHTILHAIVIFVTYNEKNEPIVSLLYGALLPHSVEKKHIIQR